MPVDIRDAHGNIVQVATIEDVFDNVDAIKVNLGTISGAATAANQATAQTSLTSIATNTAAGATAANQGTGNTSLATIATQTNTTKGSGVVDATTLRVVQASDGPSVTALGATTDAAATGNGSIIGVLKRVRDILTDVWDSTLHFLKVQQQAGAVTATTMQSAATGTGNGTSLDVSGMAVAALQTAGTFVGTVTFESSTDDSNWIALSGENLATGAIVSTATVTNTVVGFRVAGIKSIRARISAYTSGSITVTGRAQAVDSQLPLTQSVLYTATGTALTTLTGGSDSVSAGGTGIDAISQQTLYDASAGVWNRQRNNNDVTVLASAARTATTNSSDQTNYNGRSLRVDIDITAAAGSPSIVFSIQLKDALSGVYTTVLSSAAQTGTGHVQLQYGAGAATTANLSAPGIVGRLWRVIATHSTADSVTYSIGASVNV
jgi:hypothetical protein